MIMDDPVSYETVQLPRDENGPVFDRPWQAQAFALTVELYKNGRFTWPEWVEIFSEEIKRSPALPGESVNDAYYRQWIAALEKMATSRNLVTEGDLPTRAEEWRQAYLNTPHGKPILLANALCGPAATHRTHHHHHHAHEHEHEHDEHHHAVRRAPVAVVAPLSN